MKKTKNTGRIILWLCLTAILSGSCFFIGRSTAAPAVEQAQAEIVPAPTEPAAVDLKDHRRLRIDLEVSQEHVYTAFTPEQLGGNVENDLTYNDVTNVSIELEDQVLHLEEAIRDGLITPEEMVAYARIDARKGICQEWKETEHGLTTFIYRYPKFDLRVVYDVFKSPDGKEHLIKDLDICDNAYDIVTFYSDDDGNSLGTEDWGLTMEVLDATKTGVTLRCTQRGGQQIGQLQTGMYVLCKGEEYAREEEDYVPQKEGTNSWEYYEPNLTIAPNAVSEITIDWTRVYGEVPSGTYTMRISVNDVYDPAEVHPLMENFQDKQNYFVTFTIPLFDIR